MSRSEDDDKLDRIAKYRIFKRAFDTVSCQKVSPRIQKRKEDELFVSRLFL